MDINCECQKYKMSSIFKDDFQKYRQDILSELIQLRDKCKALKNVFLISDKWKEFTYKALGVFGKEEGYCESVLLLILRKDKLKYLTSPIHKFLLNENARDDYTNNINESWFLKESFKERKNEYYGNYGKFHELLFAEWLQNNGWEITNLEAWDKDSSDVEAISPDNQSCVFEIKTYFTNLQAMEHRNKGEAYFGCGEDPREIEEKYFNLIDNAEKQFKADTDKNRIVAIIDMENKIGKFNSCCPSETIEMLKTSMQKSAELWIFKIDLFELSRIYMIIMDYRQFYDDESYLFKTVRNNFLKRNEITAFDFFCIIIWKANRAKSIMAKKLLRIGNQRGLKTLEDIVKEISSNLASQNMANKAKLSYLIETWEFRLPMASAILTILFPDNFTIYDYWVCKELKFTPNLTERKFENLWNGYLEFIQLVKNATPEKLSLRDKDRYLIGKSFHSQLMDDINNQFGITT